MASVSRETVPLAPHADPAHPGNILRPHVKCIGCGVRGCITAWGPWCFACNVERIDRISRNLGDECRRRGIKTDLGL